VVALNQVSPPEVPFVAEVAPPVPPAPIETNVLPDAANVRLASVISEYPPPPPPGALSPEDPRRPPPPAPMTRIVQGEPKSAGRV